MYSCNAAAGRRGRKKLLLLWYIEGIGSYFHAEHHQQFLVASFLQQNPQLCLAPVPGGDGCLLSM